MSWRGLAWPGLPWLGLAWLALAGHRAEQKQEEEQKQGNLLRLTNPQPLCCGFFLLRPPESTSQKIPNQTPPLPPQTPNWPESHKIGDFAGGNCSDHIATQMPPPAPAVWLQKPVQQDCSARSPSRLYPWSLCGLASGLPTATAAQSDRSAPHSLNPKSFG